MPMITRKAPKPQVGLVVAYRFNTTSVGRIVAVDLSVPGNPRAQVHWMSGRTDWCSLHSLWDHESVIAVEMAKIGEFMRRQAEALKL